MMGCLARILLRGIDAHACAFLYGSAARGEVTSVELNGQVEILSDVDVFVFSDLATIPVDNVSRTRDYLRRVLPMRNSLFHLGVKTQHVLGPPNERHVFHLIDCQWNGAFLGGIRFPLRRLQAISREKVLQCVPAAVETAVSYGLHRALGMRRGPIAKLEHAYRYAKLCLSIIGIAAGVHGFHKGTYSAR